MTTRHDWRTWRFRQASKFNIFLTTKRPATYNGMHHMSVNDPDSIYLAFEGFAKFIIDQKLKLRRTTTEVFLANEGLKTMKVKTEVQNNLTKMVGKG